MTIPLWTLLVATVLPYFWFGLSNPLRKSEFGTLDNNHPRLQQAKQTGKGARALAASANAFEALAVYAPAVLVAHIQSPASGLAPLIAIVWVVVRALHGIAYIGDKAALRTALFTLGSLCALALYLVGAHVL
ncbi:MAG TPA: MAPEG family protein [Polyangiaceae bacterium]|jgi:uncharacterized MAPEG superfamily protein|nr:MAPEG family protein [Polyangiaceae bacterium]